MIDIFWLLEVSIFFWIVWIAGRWIEGWLRQRRYDEEREARIDSKTYDWRRMDEHRRRFDEAQRRGR